MKRRREEIAESVAISKGIVAKLKKMIAKSQLATFGDHLSTYVVKANCDVDDFDIQEA